MRISPFVLFTLVSVTLYTSCATEKNVEEEDLSGKTKGKRIISEMEIVDSELIPDELPLYNATRTRLTDLVHTNLAVSFDWSKSQMKGIATITAMQHFYASDSLFLDAKGMQINTVSVGSLLLNYRYENDVLAIKLPKVYQGGEKFTVAIDYIAKPDERTTSGSAAITSDKGLYFINPKNEVGGFMPQIWTQGETEASSVWFPTIDSPNQKTTQQIAITVDKKYATLSNGKLVSEKQNTDGTRTDTWVQDKPHAPYLFMMGVGEFVVVKDVYVRPDGSKMDVNYYVEPEYAGQAKAIFGETPAMIKYFSKLLGVEYPWDKYSQIIVREYVSGAMENTGAVTFGDYAYKDSRELMDENDNSTIAHELFHHWFGDLVTCESWSNLSVNESFANYSQYLWDENRYGLDEADYQASQEMQSYFNEFASGVDHDLIHFGYNNQEDMFDRHTYNKGGRILHMLRNHIGDAAFFKGLNLYLEQNKFKAAEAQQLRLALEEVTGQDLNWFFNQWYYGAGFPVLEVQHNHEYGTGVASVTVTQRQVDNGIQLFRIPVEVAVYDGAGVTIHKVELNQQQQTFNFPVTGTLQTIVFDHQQMLLTQMEEIKTEEMWVAQYKLAKRWKARQVALDNIGEINKNELILLALNDAHWSIRAQAVNEINASMKQPESLVYRDAILKMATSDKNYNVRVACLSYIEANAPAKDLPSIFQNIVLSDSSYTVVGSAIASLYRLDEKLALAEARKLAPNVKNPLLSVVSSVLGAAGDKTDLAFFSNQIATKSFSRYDGISILNGLAILGVKLETEDQTKIVGLIQKLKATGNANTKMFVPNAARYLAEAIEKNQAKSPANDKNIAAFKAMME